jgi:hypothetical protein
VILYLRGLEKGVRTPHRKIPVSYYLFYRVLYTLQIILFLKNAMRWARNVERIGKKEECIRGFGGNN